MPEEVAVQAESATATPEGEIKEVDFDLGSLSVEQLQKWERTGELPDPKADSDPQKDLPEGDTEAKAEGDAEPESGTGKPKSTEKQQPKLKTKSDTEKRFQELLRERNEAKAELERLKSEGRGEKPKPEPVKAKPAELKRPKLADFANAGDDAAVWAAYEDALAEYAEKQAEVAVERYKASEAEKAAKAETQKAADAWAAAIEEASEGLDDFDEVAFSEDVPMTDLMSGFIVQKGVDGAKMLYYLGQNPKEAKAIAAMSPLEAVESLVLLQQKVKGGAAAKADEPKPKLVTKAKPLPTELGGSGSLQDPISAAQAANDYEAYEREMNARQFGRR